MRYAPLALVPLFVWTTVAWVFIDAGRRDLSDSVFHTRRSWTFAVFVMWIAFFPLYLWDRSVVQLEDLAPREDLLALWDGIDTTGVDRITRRALKRAAAARGQS